MNNNKSFLITLSLSLLIPNLLMAGGADPVPSVSTSAVDNTQMNQRDRSVSEPTASQAQNAKSDVELMSEIRRAIVEDKSLSTYAHNVKIIAQQGNVTLKGAVHTQAEKDSIGQKASAIAGAENVTNRLMVKGS